MSGGVFSKFFNNFYLKNLVAAVVIGVALLLATLYWLDVYTLHNQALIIPDVRGVSVGDAASFISAKSLRYEVIDSVYAKDKPPGTIIEQIPAANSKVKENRIVFLVVNATNVQKIAMPDVVDNSQRQAEATLRTAGFKISEIQLVQSQWKGLVLDVLYMGRSVPTGTMLPSGAAITLKVGGEIELDSLHVDESAPAELPKNEESWF